MSPAEADPARYFRCSRRLRLNHRNRVFITFTLCGGIYSAGTFAYVAGAPFAYVENHGVWATAFSILFGANVFGAFLVTYLTLRLVITLGSITLFRAGMVLAALSRLALYAKGRLRPSLDRFKWSLQEE